MLLASCGGSTPPNVVLVAIDTLRADHTSLYGYGRDTTPALAEWAKGGTVFERAHSMSSWTLPSMSMLMTGQVQVKNEGKIFPRQESLAEILRARGYRTGAVVANELLTSERGFDAGFDEYELYQREPGERLDAWKAAEVTEHAKGFLSDVREPFFLQLHYYDPHEPYEPIDGRAFEIWDRPERMEAFRGALPPDRRDLLDRKSYRGIEDRIVLYDSEVLQADRGLADFLRALEEEGFADDTIVVITADHGEGLWQRAQTLGESPGKGAYFRELYYGHGVQLFDEQVRVPLVFRGPGIPAGARSDAFVSLIDVVPTLLGLLEVPRPELMAGAELFPLGQGGESDRPVYSICSRGRTVTVDGRYRLHEPRDYKREQGVLPELFDLETDPLELEPLADPVREADLRARVEAWIAAHEAIEWDEPDAIRAEGIPADLTALGYADVALEPGRHDKSALDVDLAIAKTVDDATPAEHQDVVFTITVTNTDANLPASGVRVADALPEGVSFVSATPSQGGYALNSGIWAVGALGAGVEAVLELTVRVDAGMLGRTIVNTAQLLGLDQNDPNAANDAASVAVVVGNADE